MELKFEGAVRRLDADELLIVLNGIEIRVCRERRGGKHFF